jgi:elongation factor G
MASKTSLPDLSKLRNIGVIAHIDAGKTTTTEHILYYSGAIHRLGGVDEGTTETDWMELERQKGITIQSACVPFRWLDYHLNLIDTPGHVDFTAEVERSLRVLDGAVVVFDAQKGVEAQSETVWRQADKYGVPRLVFINKMDIVGADFFNALAEVRERLQARPVAIAIPIGSGSSKDSPTPFRGVIDLVTLEACFFEDSAKGRADGKTVRRMPIPEEQLREAQVWRDKLFDVLTEADDRDLITSLVLEGKPVPAEAVRELIRKRTLKNEIQPVLCGSGREHMGVQPLMDAVCWYLPSPLDRPPVVGKHARSAAEKGRKADEGKDVTRPPDPKAPFAALVFKIQADPHGELYYLRVYSGTMKANSRVLNAGKGVKEFLTKLYHVHADPSNKDPLDSACAGDIVAAIGPKESITGDTLCDPQEPILLESIHFAETVVSMSVEPESSADKAKLEQTLTTLGREDPTFRWHVDPDTGQTLISGMGVLHLEIKTHRLREDFRLKVKVSKPYVSYRETLRKPVKVWGECIKQTGQTSLFARVQLQFEHHRGEEPITFINALHSAPAGKGGPVELPPLFLAAIEQGVRAALQSGEVGYPVTDVQAKLVNAEMHPTDSNEVAFQAATADAVSQALKDNIVLLEPVMHLEVTVPDAYLGPVTADLGSRRAEITEVHQRGNLRTIEALVPLAKMFDYADAVRSLSQGRASHTLEPHRYAPAPDEVLRKLLGDDGDGD